MPQGSKKLASKRPKDVVVRADKEKLRKQTPKMKKGGKCCVNVERFCPACHCLILSFVRFLAF